MPTLVEILSKEDLELLAKLAGVTVEELKRKEVPKKETKYDKQGNIIEIEV